VGLERTHNVYWVIISTFNTFNAGLFWNGNQKKPWNLYAFDPDLVEYIAFSLDFMATSGLYGILIAMQRCARVDLYGFQV
jgi:hypothetical protein